MNCIYLVQSGPYFKIGFTNNIQRRMLAYVTANPQIRLVETIQTQVGKKHRLETLLHQTLLKTGHTFQVKYGIETEWVKVKNPKEFAARGFSQFQISKTHKRTIYPKDFNLRALI